MGALRAAAAALCRNPAVRDDLVQDTFLRALGHIERGHAPIHPRAWLTKILLNAFIDRVRSRRFATQELEDCPAPEPDPEPPWGSVTAADVRAACASIDPDLR